MIIHPTNPVTFESMVSIPIFQTRTLRPQEGKYLGWVDMTGELSGGTGFQALGSHIASISMFWRKHSIMTIITARHILLNGYMFAVTQITALETLLQASKSDMRQVYLWLVMLGPLKGSSNTGDPDIISPGDPMKTRESIWTMVFPSCPSQGCSCLWA